MPLGRLAMPVIMNETVPINTTRYSKGVLFRDNAGEKSALIITSSAGSIDITQQCSIDGETWYDAQDVAGDALGIRMNLTVTTGVYVLFTPVLCEWIRFKVVEGNVAATLVTMRLIYRMEA